MNEQIKTKALKQLRVCNFCGTETEPIGLNADSILPSFKCKICGSIGTLEINSQGNYCICWTLAEKESSEATGLHEILKKYTPEQMKRKVSAIEADTGYNAYARQLCNQALRELGKEPVF